MSRRYSDEARVEAVALAERIGVKPAARQLGLKGTTLYRWTHPEYAERVRKSSLAAKARRRRLCVRGCGATCAYDNPSGVCTRCQNKERAVWTRESVVEAVRWFYSTVNRAVRLSDFHPAPSDGLPYWRTIRGLGFKIPDLCAAAGVPFYSGYRGMGARGGDTSHGTYNRYSSWGCRCAECRAANAARSRQRHARLAANSHVRVDPEPSEASTT